MNKPTLAYSPTAVAAAVSSAGTTDALARLGQGTLGIHRNRSSLGLPDDLGGRLLCGVFNGFRVRQDISGGAGGSKRHVLGVVFRTKRVTFKSKTPRLKPANRRHRRMFSGRNSDRGKRGCKFGRVATFLSAAR